MKKANIGYVAAWYGGFAAAVILLVAVGLISHITPIAIAGMLLVVAGALAIPVLLRKKMETVALALEKTFEQTGFTYQHKFTSNSGVFYIDQGGRLGVLWKYNPFEIQFANLGGLTDVHTNNGKRISGTELVSCQFKLDGAKYKIYTLRVSNGQLSMKDPRVIEAIQKADNLCAMLNRAKAAAQEARA